MRVRQLGLATVIALLLAQLSGAVVAAGPQPFVAQLLNTSCSSTGGSHGGGYLSTRAKGTENGNNGSNWIVLRGQFQRKSGASWVNLGDPVVDRSPMFPDGAASHSHARTFRIDFVTATSGTYRYSVKFTWRDDQPGQDVTVKTITKATFACTIT